MPHGPVPFGEGGMASANLFDAHGSNAIEAQTTP